MAQHDRYDTDILKALQRIATSLGNIERYLIGSKEYSTVEYGKDHPKFVEKINRLANENKED